MRIRRPDEKSIEAISSIVAGQGQLFLKQKLEMGELILNFETKNKYEILTSSGQYHGAVIEESGGFWGFLNRTVFRSHRPFKITVYNKSNVPILRLERKFFWMFSDLFISDSHGTRIGSIHRRFGLLRKKYDLMDFNQMVFAQINAPIWRIWTFKIFDVRGKEIGSISKKWTGVFKEVFTDSDSFGVDLSYSEWDTLKKVIVFCAAISVDFDFFEDNSNRH
tara:strand:- start:288 stop:950 length:663 start_codon:yes stop_codon:yes gene_type:complete